MNWHTKKDSNSQNITPNKYCSPTRGAFLTGRMPYHLPNTRHNTPHQNQPSYHTYTYAPLSLLAHSNEKSNNRSNLIPWSLPDGTDLEYDMIPKTLAKAGYRSVHIGKWHQGFYRDEFTPVGRGFNYSFGFLEGGEDHWTSASFNAKPGCQPNGVDLSYGWDNGTTVRAAPRPGRTERTRATSLRSRR